ncbi:MAG: copper chaperone PCu(A)C [Halioglobus sp.]
MRRVWAVGLVAILLSLAVEAEQKTNVEFENVWVRAMPPFQTNSAGYLTLTNRGDTAIAIVGASSNVAEKVELHTTRKVDGLMRMEPLEALAVAPGERVELAPGGMHLMMFGLAFRLVPDDDVRLCLQLASGDEVCADADVRKNAEAPDSADHQHHQHQQPKE